MLGFISDIWQCDTLHVVAVGSVFRFQNFQWQLKGKYCLVNYETIIELRLESHMFKAIFNIKKGIHVKDFMQETWILFSNQLINRLVIF